MPGEDRSPTPEELQQQVIDEYMSSVDQQPLDTVPQIPLPISREAEVHKDVQNLFRAMLINQNNLMSNTEFLHNTLKDAHTRIDDLKEQLDLLNSQLTELQVATEEESGYDTLSRVFRAHE